MQGGVTTHIVGEGRPIGGVGAVHGNGDGRSEHFRGMPQAAGNEEDLAGV